VGQLCLFCLVNRPVPCQGMRAPTWSMKGQSMANDHLSENEAHELGARLEAVCQEFSSRQREFLKTALRLAAADVWARSSESPPETGIQDLIIDIQQAGATRAISLNPLPLPINPKGTIT
jgi:hypothetical protein